VLTEVLGTVATCSTIARTWPQFVRIAVRKDKEGVSLATWSLALTNHTGWFMYGILTAEPVFIISNIFAGFGCAATVVTLQSWKRMAQIAFAAAILTVAIFYGISASATLVVIVAITMSMMLPQLWSIFRSPATGVSVTAWLVSALSSITWIAWAQSIHRLTVVVAHFVLLPAALIIATRAIYAQHRPRPIVDIAEADVAATTAP
jgi:uncharacterized protein with PQ loop repeat